MKLAEMERGMSKLEKVVLGMSALVSYARHYTLVTNRPVAYKRLGMKYVIIAYDVITGGSSIH